MDREEANAKVTVGISQWPRLLSPLVPVLGGEGGKKAADARLRAAAPTAKLEPRRPPGRAGGVFPPFPVADRTKVPMPPDASHICVVIGRTRHKMIQVEIQEAAKQGAKMIELRLDYLAKAPDFKRLLADKPCPLVATVRRPQDGGRWNRSEVDRQMLLRQAVVAGFDWVDLETDVAEVVRRFKNVKRIVSYHNLRDVPSDLEDIHAKMCGQ